MYLTDSPVSHTGEKLWYKDVQTIGKSSRARRILPEEYKKTFANKQIVCVEYQDITDADEREIFQVRHGFSFFFFVFFLTLFFTEGSTWNGSHAVRLAYYSTFPTDKLTSLFLNLKKSCKL